MITSKLETEEEASFKVDAFKEFLNQLEEPKNIDIEKLNLVFDLIDEGVENKNTSVNGLEKVDLERSALNGLNNRRSEMEILAFMLKSARKEVRKTSILYKANISGKQLKNYLYFLINAGFIEEKNVKKKGQLFKTTSKGNLFLYHWTKILKLLESSPEEDKKNH